MASAERRTSAAAALSAEMLGMRDRVTSVFMKSSKCCSAYLSADLTLPFDSAIRRLLEVGRRAWPLLAV